MDVVDLVSSGEERDESSESSESEVILESVDGNRGSPTGQPTSTTVTAINSSPTCQPHPSTRTVDAQARFSHARAGMFVKARLHHTAWPSWPAVVIDESDLLSATPRVSQYYHNKEKREG